RSPRCKREAVPTTDIPSRLKDGPGVTPMNDEEKVVAGCAIVDEFIGQGAATGGGRSSEPWPLLPSSAFEGCMSLTIFSDQGFIPSSEAKMGAREEAAQKSPKNGLA